MEWAACGLLTQEGRIQSHIEKPWEKLKIEDKPYKLAPGHGHLPRHNLWKIEVYLEVRIVKSSILWLSLK